jgi:hypothetical protein
VRWGLQYYGSLDRVRVFVAKSQVAPMLADALALPEGESDYFALLEQCEYHVLFDSDWEYFFVITCKPFVSHVLSRLRRACHELGGASDTTWSPTLNAYSALRCKARCWMNESEPTSAPRRA